MYSRIAIGMLSAAVLTGVLPASATPPSLNPSESVGEFSAVENRFYINHTEADYFFANASCASGPNTIPQGEDMTCKEALDMYEADDYVLHDAKVEYDFKALTSVPDQPTRQSARRFYEWNPPQDIDQGALIAAHIYRDIETFRYAAPSHNRLFGVSIDAEQITDGDYTDADAIPQFYLANERSWVDMAGAFRLAAGAQVGVPGDVLLTKKDKLSPEVRETLLRAQQRAGKKGNVHIVGGELAVTPGVANEIAAMGWTVQRTGGATRIDTIANANKPWKSELPKKEAEAVLTITRGYASEGAHESGAYADLLSAPALSYADLVYVTHSDRLADRVMDDIKRHATQHGGRIRAQINLSGIIVGGPVAISPHVEHQIKSLKVPGVDDFGKPVATIPTGVKRMPGANRFETNALAYKSQFPERMNALPYKKMLVLVDGESDTTFQVGFAARGLDYLVVYTQGEHLPEPTRQILEAFGNPESYLEVSDGHRAVFCYASASACAKAREIVTAQPKLPRTWVSDLRKQ